MGVHGLWELLAPVGRRVSVETLAGKRLAIDASIWIIQFMKAMRDEKGEMVRNAHILGFFRRICKLLYLRTKPVFVFDGGTPALKRRTVIARRRQRENAQAKIRKTAEKLLLNHLKAMRLKELAADLEKQRQENDIKGKRPLIQEPSNQRETEKGNDEEAVNFNQEELDEMLAASLAAEENECFSVDASTSGTGLPDDEVFGDGEEDDEEDEEMILPEMHGKVDPAVLASLPPSMQLDLLVQMRERLMAENRQKYQKVKKVPARFSELQIEAYLKTVAFRREIDGVQKSAAGRGIGGMQTSRIASEANREFIFSSSFTGDKQALTSVGQERVEANQTQSLRVNCSTKDVNKDLTVKESGGAAGPTVLETGKSFHDDVETYLDERGRLRVSRVRALGIRMTRDLQRNLDLMEEIDQKKADTNQGKNNESTTAENLINVLENSSGRIQNQEVVDKNNDEINNEVDKTDEPTIVNGNSIEISFEDSFGHEYGNDDDKLFASLVAGDPVVDFSVDNSTSLKQSLHSVSDCEWEEGVIEDKSTAYLHEGCLSYEGEVEWEEGNQDNQLKSSSYPDKTQKTVTKGDVEEEADFQEAIRRSLEDKMDSRLVNDFHEDDISKEARQIVNVDDDWVYDNEGKEGPEVESAATGVSQPFGSMEALESSCSEAKSAAFIELNPVKRKVDLKVSNEDVGESGALAGEILVASDALPDEKGFCVTGNQLFGSCGDDSNGHAANKLVDTCNVEVGHNCINSAFSSSFTDSMHGTLLDSGSADAQNMVKAAVHDHSCNTAELGNISADDSITDVDGTKELTKEKICGNFSVGKQEDARNSSSIDENKEHGIMEDHLEEEMLFLGKEREELGSEKICANFSLEKQEVTRNSSFIHENKEREIMEGHLEEEMMFLGKERVELGSEQRKLERNAESVSNEMFAECQELLQIFGLPYIIAPMEAEAQCAFMELSNLVDGVVTDDSDAFLFGARSVYKNIFDDRKYVETYLMKDIETELGLDREKLILMALLLGSDYTEGISGIGIVNAIEVVNAFPGKDGLREFREWIESPDPTILGKLDVEAGGDSRRKGSKGSLNIMSGSSSNLEGISCDENEPQPVDDAQKIKQLFMDKHRNVSKNWHISSSFPSDAVISAYATPQVDKSTESLSWGKPDQFVLRKLCWEKFGWGASKADELLLAVLKEYNKHETQLRLEAFYTFNERFAKIRSKRIKKAVKGIAGHKSSELIDDTTPQHSGRGKKRKVKPAEEEADQSGVGSTGLDGVGTSSQNNTMEKPTVNQVKRGRAKEKISERNLEQSTTVDGNLINRKESHVRGRSRGRGRRQLSGRGKKKNISFSADTETSYDGRSSNESDEEMQFDRSEESLQVRRSGRRRKVVNYTIPDELDNSEKESEDGHKEGLTANDSFTDPGGSIVNESVGHQLNEGSDVKIGSELVVEETEQTYMINKMSTSFIDDDTQMDDASNQSHLSKNYPQFGGGFCLDEDEEKSNNVLDGGDAVVDENCENNTSIAISGPLNDRTDLSGVEANINYKRPCDDHCSLDDAENDSGNRRVKSLRAMPNLRRKKRKN